MRCGLVHPKNTLLCISHSINTCWSEIKLHDPYTDMISGEIETVLMIYARIADDLTYQAGWMADLEEQTW